MFGHPSQKHHEIAGLQKAIASSKTPAHLKPHLHKRLQEHTMNSSAYPTVKPANLYKTVRAGKTVNPIFNMDQIASGTSAGTDVSQPAATKQTSRAVTSAPKAPLHG